MKNIKRFINLKIEVLFQKALKGNKIALFVINFSQCFAKTPYGIWLFRKGDINSSLALLKKIKHPSFLVKRCIKRCEDINNYMNTPLPKLHSKPQNRKQITFNNKILFAVHSNGYYHPNGYAVRTHNIIEALKEKNIRVDCTTRLGYPWDLSETSNTNKQISIDYKDIKFQLTFDPKNMISGPESQYINEYAKILTNQATINNSTVIHAHSSYINGIASSKAAQKLNIKSCYEVRGLWHLSRAIKEPLFYESEHFYYCEKMELLACHLVDNIFCLTETMKQWLIDKGMTSKKITVTPNGVGNNLLTTKQSIPIKNEKLTLGFIGSITEYEGLDIVIKSLTKIKQTNIELIIAGNGKYLIDLKKLVKYLKLTNRVKFLGRISKEQVKQLYTQIDIIMINRKISPLTQLVSPIKHIEAFAYGVPCIVSRLPALTEAAQDKKNCLVVTPNSVTETAEAIILLHQDRNLLKSLTENTTNIVESKYNWKIIADSYLRTYAKIK